MGSARPAGPGLPPLLGVQGGNPETRPCRSVTPATLAFTAHRCPLPYAAGHSDGYGRLGKPAMLFLSPESQFWSYFPRHGFSHGNSSA